MLVFAIEREGARSVTSCNSSMSGAKKDAISVI